MSWWTVVRALVELLILLSVFLFVIPLTLSVVEIELGFQRFVPEPVLASWSFLVFTLVATWAGVTLAAFGDTTPFSRRAPRRLVTQGPYAFVRNPFAIGVLGQGSSLVLALGSVPVLIYVAIAGVLWYFLVRPREERYLLARFGDEWSDYVRHVRAYRPRLTPYQLPMAQIGSGPVKPA